MNDLDTTLQKFSEHYRSLGYGDHDVLNVSVAGDMMAEPRGIFPMTSMPIGTGVGEAPMFYWLHPSCAREGSTLDYRGRKWTVDASAFREAHGDCQAILFAHAKELRAPDPRPLELGLNDEHPLLLTPFESEYLRKKVIEPINATGEWFLQTDIHRLVTMAHEEGRCTSGGDMVIWEIPDGERLRRHGGAVAPVTFVELRDEQPPSPFFPERLPSDAERIRDKMAELCLWHGIPHARMNAAVAIRTIVLQGLETACAWYHRSGQVRGLPLALVRDLTA